MIINLKAHTTIKLLIIILKSYESHPTTIELQFCLPSLPTVSLSLLFPVSHTRSFRQRHDGGSHRFSHRAPSRIAVGLDSKVSFITISTCPHSYWQKILSSLSLYLIFYLISQFSISGCIFSPPCTSSSLSKLLSNKQSGPQLLFSYWSHFCCIHTQVWWVFSVLLLRQSWLCVVLLIWLPGYRWLRKTLHPKTPLPVSSSYWHRIFYHIHSRRQIILL